MEYFKVFKTEKEIELDANLILDKGYTFTHKYSITIYNKNLAKTILKRKIELSLKNIFKELIALDEDDGDGVASLKARIETLKNLLLSSYYPYIGESATKVYLLKLEDIKTRLPKEKSKKSRTR